MNTNMPSMNAPTSNSTPNNTKPLMGGRRTRKASRKNRKDSRKNRKEGENMMGGARMPAVGSKAQVFHGTARHTSGGLTKKDLVQNKHGRIVSRRKMALGKKALKHLVKAGYKATRGKFVAFTKKSKKH